MLARWDGHHVAALLRTLLHGTTGLTAIGRRRGGFVPTERARGRADAGGLVRCLVEKEPGALDGAGVGRTYTLL